MFRRARVEVIFSVFLCFRKNSLLDSFLFLRCNSLPLHDFCYADVCAIFFREIQLFFLSLSCYTSANFFLHFLLLSFMNSTKLLRRKAIFLRLKLSDETRRTKLQAEIANFQIFFFFFSMLNRKKNSRNIFIQAGPTIRQSIFLGFA